MSEAADGNFMLSLARGLAVLEHVARAEGPVTVADASRASGFSRAAVRRCLHTLERIGYVRLVQGGYSITAKPISLAHALMTPGSLAIRAQPLLDRLRDDLEESCSIGIIDEGSVRYLARAQAYRLMSIGLSVGSRLPLHATSMGRVLLAGLPEAELDQYLTATKLLPMTSRTETDPATLKALVNRVAQQGYAIVDQELELGLRSIAVPITSRGVTVAAINVGTSTARVPLHEIRTRFRTRLQATARQMSN